MNDENEKVQQSPGREASDYISGLLCCWCGEKNDCASTPMGEYLMHAECIEALNETPHWILMDGIVLGSQDRPAT